MVLTVYDDLNVCYNGRPMVSYIQCWVKLLLKVMHYNIVLLPKKVSNCYLDFMESNALLFKYEQGLIVCF